MILHGYLVVRQDSVLKIEQTDEGEAKVSPAIAMTTVIAPAGVRAVIFAHPKFSEQEIEDWIIDKVIQGVNHE